MRSPGLGGVPNDPVQILQEEPDLDTACQVLNSQLVMPQICKTCMCRPCLPGSETLASSYVDVKSRQRVSDKLTTEKRIGTITVVLKRIIWGIRIASFVDRFPDLKISGFRYGIFPIGWIR